MPGFTTAAYFKLFFLVTILVMTTFRSWAFWRRVEYLLGIFLFLAIIFAGIYFAFIYESANCFDGEQNGEERGIDCAGECVRICAFETVQPKVLWSKSFKIVDGQYNAVAYVEGR